MSNPTPHPSSITVYATSGCPDCRRSKKWLEDNQVPFNYFDIDHSNALADLVRQLNNGYRSVPTILFPNGDILVEPTNEVLAEKVRQFNMD